MIALTLTVFVLMATLFVEPELQVPSQEDCKRIRVAIDTGGWILDFNADGSGSIGYGSLPMDHGGFRKGTVSFSDLYQSLVPALQTQAQADESGKRRWLQVSFMTETDVDGKQYKTFLTLDSDAVAKAFKQSLNGSDPRFANRMEFLLLHQNPFPKPDDALLDWSVTVPREEIVKQLTAAVEEAADAFEQIVIHTRLGWKLTINRDGSGELSIGRHPGLTSAFPADTFEFSQTYESHILKPLRATLRELSEERRVRQHRRQTYISIAAKPRGKPVSLMIPDVRDITAVRELFDRAREVADHPKEPPPEVQGFEFQRTIDDFWKTNPPARLPESTK